MIRLTLINADIAYDFWMNPDEIIGFGKIDGDYTNLILKGGELRFKESPKEVARKVLEWRLAMERYRASCIAAASDPEVDTNLAMELNEKDLKELAGLEEQA